jgi:hypothetical protein
MNQRNFPMSKITGALAALLLLNLICAIPPTVFAEEDAANPYGSVRLSRISLIEGEVLLQRGDDEEWVAASVNMPLRPHDKLWATNGARAEIQFDDGTAVRIAENTNLDLLALETGWIQVQLTLGVASFTIPESSRTAGTTSILEIDTPQATAQANPPAVFRVDVAEDGSTEIKVRDGEVDLNRDEEPVVIFQGQRVAIEGGDAPSFVLETAPEPDEWDQWTEDRDALLARARSREHLPSETEMGASELDAYGRWDDVPTYGWVWIPQVTAGWAPYRAGRWVWVEPWGWTWVSYEPWGWLPYHYGRWVVVGSVGWVWVPGPRFGIWAPGCVRFIYGPTWVVWVPLGPGEVYYYRPVSVTKIDIRLVNYDAPGGRTVMSRRRFVTGHKEDKKFIPPKNPARTGRWAAGPPPIVPTRASLHPSPVRPIPQYLLPPRATHRPVVHRHTPPDPPPLFERRIKEIKNRVTKGLPPAEAAAPPSRKRPPGVEGRHTEPERIRKDIMIRETITRHRTPSIPKQTTPEPKKRIAPSPSPRTRQPVPPRSIRLPRTPQEPPAPHASQEPPTPRASEERARGVRPLYRVPPHYNPKKAPDQQDQQPPQQQIVPSPPGAAPGHPHR